MVHASHPLATLLAIVVVSLAGVLLAIVRLLRSGRSVRFPDLRVRPPEAGGRHGR